jgi:class 3 adenylate cyclase/pimeloyl-ACP methyl ester carboxylesterase
VDRRTGYAQVDGLSIAYQIYGDGPRHLIVVPGYMTNIDQNWEWPGYARFLERLGSFAKVILVDRRGTGLSDRMPAHSSFEDTMDDVRAVMDEVGVPQAALVGAGEGGPTCMLFAATFPERTTALVLAAPFFVRAWAPDVPWGITPEAAEGNLRAIARKWGREPMGIHAFTPSLVGDPAYVEWYLRAQRAGGTPAAARAWFETLLHIDVRRILPAINVPTLVLHRVDDRVLSVESSRFAASQIPGARLVELPGNDHFWFSGDANQMLDEIEAFVTGVRPAAQIDRVLATILFTDIVGSTESAARLGDRAWRQLLARHYDITREEIERHRGKLAETTGDGVKATFDGPARAVRGAQSIIERVASLGIEIRAGVHTGEVELRAGDYGGIAVHIAARVCARAGPSEVLVSSTVKDLVVGSGLRFEDRGSHTLKGVPDEWRLFALAR